MKQTVSPNFLFNDFCSYTYRGGSGLCMEKLAIFSGKGGSGFSQSCKFCIRVLLEIGLSSIAFCAGVEEVDDCD